LMPCGEHTCERGCHEGLCGSCEFLVDSRCYCGRVEKSVPCSDRGEQKESRLLKAVAENNNPETSEPAPNKQLPEAHDTVDSWIGSFQC
jgi:hypothetical protein